MPDIETHLAVSNAGILGWQQEHDIGHKEVETLANVAHNVRDISPPIAGGSFCPRGMVTVPCSKQRLAAGKRLWLLHTDFAAILSPAPPM
jgi:4-hydroxy-3-polyprenylbenzoate decarboxylase